MNVFKNMSSKTANATAKVGSEQKNPTSQGQAHAMDPLDMHVVILNNYLRKHHVAVYRELAKRVKKLTILLSVPMEPDRAWQAEWDGLDVQIQKNFMLTSWWRHSSGFSEANFIHLPTDSISRLRKLKPDLILSYEMGVRTLLCAVYRRLVRKVPLVMVGNMSEHIEKERGFFRRLLRKIICRGADYFTYNGPSCKRYLESLNIRQERLFHFPYCIDTNAVNVETSRVRREQSPETRRLLYCGAISERKGILQFAQALGQWCKQNPDRKVELSIAGAGLLKSAVDDEASNNFQIEFLGNCDKAELRSAYAKADIAVFPSLADEWGLVPVEAMASGLPVLGSYFAQSIESCCEEGVNGWVFDPTQSDTMIGALDRALNCSDDQLLKMGQAARESVAHISPVNSANCILDMVAEVMPEQFAVQSIAEQRLASSPPSA